MVQEKYIGIENELTSFNSYNEEGFNSDDFKNLLKDKHFRKSETCIRSYNGNGYYIDGSEIEIITPPIALNRGFATRLTNSLLLGRNYVIKNTPDMKHTGYSMHWNLSHNTENFDSDYYRYKLINDLSVPFQLFGLTPLSCGFNIRTDKYSERYEILGDSLTNIDQVTATALLLGAYSQATENKSFFTNVFPIDILGISDGGYVNNMFREGRYSKIDTIIDNKKYSTQAQNVLELFYEWLNPFVYRLGERDEINNLEAFIKRDKKLEMDDLKYFELLEKNKGLGEGNCYMPIEINTRNGVRSPVLQVVKENEIKTPIEGKLLGIYAINNTIENQFVTTNMDWETIVITKKIEKMVEKKRLFGPDIEKKVIETRTEYINGIHEIYEFAEQYQSEAYLSSINTSNVKLNNIIDKSINVKLKKRIRYSKNKDLSA
jgi:hypothetical protein